VSSTSVKAFAQSFSSTDHMADNLWGDAIIKKGEDCEKEAGVGDYLSLRKKNMEGEKTARGEDGHLTHLFQSVHE